MTNDEVCKALHEMTGEQRAEMTDRLEEIVASFPVDWSDNPQAFLVRAYIAGRNSKS